MSRSALAAGVRYLRDVMALHGRDQENDEQLLHAFASRRDDSAFAALVGRHGPMVMNVCRRVLGQQQDAEDAFQATFLVLARKAALLRDKTALAAFLHGTAYRMAMKAKQSAARRRAYEGQAISRSPADPVDELSWREVRTLLDEEISRLPEKYRSVFILCVLEGVSREEAAKRLRLKGGTVSSRLTMARKRLAQRLARRGVELTAVLAAVAVMTPLASALPMALMTSTIKAAMATTVGEGSSGIVSASVAELVRDETAAMMASKAKLATVLLFAITLSSGAGVCLLAKPQPQQEQPFPAQRTGEPPADVSRTAKRGTVKNQDIQGRVLDPDGRPKGGAKLVLLDEDEKITELGVTAADGRFTVTVPREPEFSRPFRYLIAQTDGTGIDFLDLRSWAAGKPVELRLVKDNIVRGRVVNTEGRPVAGVRVAAQTITTHVNNSLDTFLAAYIKVLAGGKGHAEQKSLWYEGGGLFAATTDADGRFALQGIGAERTVGLHLSGGGIAAIALFNVVNRAGFDPKPYNQAFRDYFTRANRRKDQLWMLPHLLSGPDISVVAESEKVICGTVADTDNGKGQAGLEVKLMGYSDLMPQSFFPTAKTDAAGRYEIHGARKAKRYLIQFLGDSTSGYIRSQVWADDTPGSQPVPANLKVKKGVIVTGKVIDGATGKAIPGWGRAAVLADNPFIKDYQYDTFLRRLTGDGEKIEADGTFRLVTLPGPVLLMGGPDHQKLPPLEAQKFKKAIPDPKYPQYFRVVPGPFIGEKRLTYTGLQGFRPNVVQGDFCKVLNVKPGVALVKQDIVLERARALAVAIQDAEGRPLSGVWATGITPHKRYSAVRLENASCPVYDLEADNPRLMVFCEPQRKLAGARTLKADEKQPTVVKLGPTGSIQGRLLDKDGKPLAGIEVDLRYRESEAEEIERAIHEGKQVVTDESGAFALDGLLPEQKFEFSFRRGSRPFQLVTKSKEAAIHVRSGECRDLGAIRVELVPERTGN